MTLAVAVAALVSVAGFAVLGQTPRVPGPRGADRVPVVTPRPTAGATPAATPLVAGVAPSSPQVLLAVSSGEAWCASAESGLWHFENGLWTNTPVAGWSSARIFDLSRSADGSLAVATDHGAAILRDGRWSVLVPGVSRHVLFAGDGTLWVALGGPSDTGVATTVDAFRLDGQRWRPRAYPTLRTLSWPKVGVGPDGTPWLGTGAYFGSLDRFDGARWVSVNPLGGSGSVNVAGLGTASDGALWAALYVTSGPRWTWAIARYHGAAWTVYRASDSLAAPGNLVAPNGLEIAPDGTAWMPTEWGLVHFDGGAWSMYQPGSRFDALSFAPDGALWVIGPQGVQELDPRQP